jgi:predicted nucleotidyltransferase
VEFDADKLKKICEKHHIDLVVLFGSRAQGNSRRDSDLDIAVHLYPYDAKCDKLGLIVDLDHLFQRTIDLVVLNTVESDTLRHEIFKHGQPLYDRAGDLFTALKVDAFLRFGDSEYLRRIRDQSLRRYLEGLGKRNAEVGTGPVHGYRRL